MASALHQALKEFSPQGTSTATAQVNTIRAKLLRIGERIQANMCRMRLSLSQTSPDHDELFRQILVNLRDPGWPPLRL
jgi:hypothetical protein